MSEKKPPNEPGTVIYTTSEGEETVAYILGKYGVWYPIAIGEHPYLSAQRMSELEWRAA